MIKKAALLAVPLVMIAFAGIASAAPSKPDLPDAPELQPPCRLTAIPERPVDCSGFIFCVQITPWSMLCEGNVVGFVKYIIDHADPDQIINPDLTNVRA